MLVILLFLYFYIWSFVYFAPIHRYNISFRDEFFFFSVISYNSDVMISFGLGYWLFADYRCRLYVGQVEYIARTRDYIFKVEYFRNR